MLPWTEGGRYRLHGYYPYFCFGDDDGRGDVPMDVACLFHVARVDGKNRALEGEVCPESWFDDLRGRGIEPWVGAGVKTIGDLETAFVRGARLITTDDPVQTLKDLKTLGHRA